VADAQPDYSGSCMIALYPPARIAAALAADGGLEPDEMHVTVAYTGDAADVDPEALNAAAQALAGRLPFTAAISGHARFTGGKQDCIVALVDAPQLETLRADARKALAEQGIGIPSEHGYTPHLTIRYLGQDDTDPVGRLAPFPVAFAAVSAVHGKVRTDYPLAGDLPEMAAEAFLSGWRLSGCDGGLGEAEFRAAIGSALDCAADPGILEATLDLGHLTGTWKTVYSRREKLLARHLKAVLAAWDACMADLDPRVLVRRFRAVMDHTAEAVDTDRQWWKDAATTAAIGWLKGLYRTEGYPALVAAIEAAIRDGMAEGEADALALAASRQGRTGFRITKAFKAAYDRLDGDPGIGHQAADTIAAIAAGAASDAGRALAAQAGDGGSEDDMTSAVDDTLTGENARAPWSWTDWAVWAAIGAGATALFRLAGIGSIAWYDVGDSRECQACMDNAAGSPYAAGSVPQFPAHIRCRCSLDAADSSPLSAFLAAYLS